MPLQHLRSSTAHKRPIPTVMSAGQIAINTNEASPGLFFKDSNGDLVKVGPVHIGTTAPNSSPASVAATALVTGTVYQILTVGTSDFTLVGAASNTIGTIFTATGTTTGTGTVSGQQGVEKGEMWLDTTGGTYVLKIYDGTDWRSESGTFVDVSGDTMTGDLVFNNADIVFEGATADDFETTLTVTDPTADRTITLPDVTGTVVTTGDTGSVTSTMILDGTIVNADVNASAAIAGTKIDPDFGSQNVVTTGTSTAASFIPTSSTVPTNGVYLPSANNVGLATNGTNRLHIASDGKVGLGTASPGNYFSDANELVVADTVDSGVTIASGSSHKGTIAFADGTTGDQAYRGYIQYNHSTDSLQLATTGTERARIDSSGRLGVGTNSPSAKAEISGQSSSINLRLTGSSATAVYQDFYQPGSAQWGLINPASTDRFSVIKDGPSGTEYFTVGSTGNVGIGTTSPEFIFDARGSINVSGFIFRRGADNATFSIINKAAQPLTFGTDDTERARITSDGKLLVGTSSGIYGSTLKLQGNSGSTSGETIIRTCRGTSSPADGDILGNLLFSDNTELPSALVQARRDGGTWSASSKPGRLVFSTTADGASSPTERMRIQNDGYVFIGKTAASSFYKGWQFNPSSGNQASTSDATTTLVLNRLTNDGVLVSLRGQSTEEGTISISGTTVSYNGAHLARWSQLPGGVERTEILRGSVLSNIDEMCEWGDEDNEQLNRMKVSDVEGDRNVAGVFQAWDDDDQIYTNDFYCAMTGDFVIRIAQGTTVARGDLLMSAGDGTAKPQDDDIVRSKTIAKVTSTVVSETYSDGSYCVPCVLMAC